MIELDGTPNKANLGANALLGVSLAVARAAAMSLGMPLYRYLGGPSAGTLPVPMMNVINGGKHAEGALQFQEIMIVPYGATNIADAVRYGAESLRRAEQDAARDGTTDAGRRRGRLRAAARFDRRCAEALGESDRTRRLQARRRHRHRARSGVVASSIRDGKYYPHLPDHPLNSAEMVALYEGLCNNYPIVSIEDGLAEDDWAGWALLTQRLGKRVQLVGDDLFVTNVERLARGIKEDSANAILVKLNQIGTLTETLDAVEMAHKAGFRSVISHRSGETEDTTIADLAVATGAGQIKTGSLARSDRVAKYNRLMAIADDLGHSTAKYPGKTAFRAFQ